MAKQLIKPTDAPFALSISGGGSHGAWSIGALKYLFEEAPMYIRNIPIFYGTSTGSLMTPMAALSVITGDMSRFEEAEKIYRNVNNADILKPAETGSAIVDDAIIPLLRGLLKDEDELYIEVATAALAGKSSVYQVGPLEDLIDRFMKPADWRRIISAGKRKRNPVEVGFCIVSLRTGQSQIVSNITHPNKDVLRKAMIASACEPFLMPAIDVFGTGEMFVDGGARDINPAKYVYKSPLFNKVSSVIAISSQSYKHNINNGKFDNLFSVLLRTIDILLGGVFDDDVDYMELKAKELGIPIYSILPLKELTGDGLQFNQTNMIKEIRQGFKDTSKQVKFN